MKFKNDKLANCFKSTIPDIKSFKVEPFTYLNDQCLVKYLDTTNQDQINKLDQLIDEA